MEHHSSSAVAAALLALIPEAGRRNGNNNITTLLHYALESDAAPEIVSLPLEAFSEATGQTDSSSSSSYTLQQ